MRSEPTTVDQPSRHAETRTTHGWAALQVAPPLALLTAAGAWLSLAIQKVALPAISHRVDHEVLLDVSDWGEFGTNLAAVAGIPSLILGLQALVQPASLLPPTRRLLVGLFSLLLTTLTMWATLFDRTRITRDLVLYGLGAAHVLTVLVIMGVLRHARTRVERVLTIVVAGTGLMGLLGHVLELLSKTRIHWAGGTRWMHGLGEGCYLLAVVLPAMMILWGIHRERQLIARFLAFLVFGVAIGAFLIGDRALADDFGLVLYHAQRLRLALDLSPLLYASPLSLGLAAGTAGLVARDPARRQLAIGLLLLMAGGYTPRGPAQLLVMALSAVLMARAVATGCLLPAHRT